MQINHYFSEMRQGVFNPIALRMAKTSWSFGHSECNRVNRAGAFLRITTVFQSIMVITVLYFLPDSALKGKKRSIWNG